MAPSLIPVDARVARRATSCHPRAHLLAVLALAAVALAAPAREVSLDVRFAPALVRAALLEHIFTGPERTFVAWRDAGECNHLVLRDPQVDVHEDRLRITAAGEARVATPVAGRCLDLLHWRGFVQTEHQPQVLSPRTRVRLGVVDSRLLDEGGQPGLLTGTVWDWVKSHVHSRLDQVEVDLVRALGELRTVLPLVLTGDGATRAQAIVDSAAIDLAGVDDTGLVLVLRLEVPELPASADAEAEPEPALSAAEMAVWDQAWRRWDAFITFVIKRAALDTTAPELRAALRDVLVEARYDIAAILSDPAPTDADANARVRGLFQGTWERLAPMLRSMESVLPGDSALRYLAFVTATDALRAIDSLGPGAGVDLSADGLRRLARIVAPGESGDPLSQSEAVDPELRRALGFGAPLEEPQPAPAPVPVLTEPGAALPGWLRALGPREARATESDPEALAARLNGWVATRGNAGTYLPLVLRLLHTTAHTAATAHPVPEVHARLFRDTLLATAWQESCWRQFVRASGAVGVLRSPAGALGIMQVNETVWRGFYSPQRLAGHIGYNARAGAEILAHYLVDLALATTTAHDGDDPLDLARAAYAAYHGGPGGLRRLRSDKASAPARAVDAAFQAKLARFRAGDDLAVMECYAR